MNLYLEMFISFFKVGLFTFGGGYAMIPIAKKELVDYRGWLNEKELIEYYSISQVSIGNVTINTNALIGFHIAKKKGAFIAALATILPSIIVIITIAALLEDILDYPIMINLFKAVRIVVSALILNTTISLIKIGIMDTFGIVLFPIVLLLIIVFKISPIILIIVSILLGFYFYPRRKRKRK